MCSRLFTGSASMPRRPSRLVAVVATRSRIRSLSSTRSAAGAANEFEDRERQAGLRPGRVDGKVGRLLQMTDAIAVLIPLGEALLPGICLRRRPLVWRLVMAARLVLVDPWPELLGRQRGKSQQQIPKIALGIDHQRRHAVDRGFLEQIDAQAGLPAARHADADGVRHQIFRIVKKVLFPPPAVLADGPAEIEESKLLVCLHVVASRLPILFRHYRQNYARRACGIVKHGLARRRQTARRRRRLAAVRVPVKMREEAARDVNANAVVSEEPVRRQRRWYHDLDRLPWRHPVRLRLAVAIPRAQDLERHRPEVDASRRRGARRRAPGR